MNCPIGRNRSIRDPNRIRPNRSPRATVLPGRDPTDDPSGDQSRPPAHTALSRRSPPESSRHFARYSTSRTACSRRRSSRADTEYRPNLPFTGHSIDMHIENIQKNTDPESPFFEKSRFVFLFDGDDFAVARRRQPLPQARTDAMGIAKKPSDEIVRLPDTQSRARPSPMRRQRCRSTERGDEGHAFFGDWNPDARDPPLLTFLQR